MTISQYAYALLGVVTATFLLAVIGSIVIVHDERNRKK